MSKKTTKWADFPSPRARIVDDFLPPPDQLIMPSEHVKITIILDRPSVDFFKAEAKRHKSKYQRMMREVLKRYAHMHARRRAA